MVRFTKESILRLREAVDIIDLISRYVPLKRSGTTWKGLCPFHDEKTPSFTVNASSRHYHCFGCGAHGDAVSFLMEHERFDFKQALEFLSERYSIPLEHESGESAEDVSRGRLKALNEAANRFFHAYLLHADEAAGARQYLAQRRLAPSFLRAFSIGYAPATRGLLSRYLTRAGFTEKEMVQAGLLLQREGKVREFFSERITFPILDAAGSTIGFSARKWREETFGGKYINTPETLLFKKSRVLFGVFYSKKRMMKDRIVCLVEGQVDALRLIEAGFDFTVATLGTAFGVPHVEQLRAMGMEEVYIAFDQDEAGLSSAEKAGQLLMKKGVGVKVVRFSTGKDPDELLEKGGKAAVFQALSAASDYVPFIVERSKAVSDWSSPRQKDAAVRQIEANIREWENPIHVYETLKQLATLAQVPESLLNVGQAPKATVVPPPVPVVTAEGKEADLMLELELIRWLLFAGPEKCHLVEGCLAHVTSGDFRHDVPRQLFCLVTARLRKGEHPDFMSFASDVDIESISPTLQTLLSRRIRLERADAMMAEVIVRLKERNWLIAREEIRKKMDDPALKDEELLALAREFDQLSKTPPKVPLFSN
jgi:DNA primase